MKYILLSILLIASVSLFIPDSFAQVEKGINYDKEFLTINPDGSLQYRNILHNYDRILNNGVYEDFIFTDEPTRLILETQAGSVTLNKNECAFNFYNGGLIENQTPLFSDSIIAFNSIVDQYSFNTINKINGATCETYFDQANTSLVAKRYATGIGYMEYKYIFKLDRWKTQLEATNLTTLEDRVFGFDQTIDLNRDFINWGGSQKNLDNFTGQTFNRTWLENNESKVLDLMNNFNYDLDLGFEFLNSVTVTDTGSNKSKLTFHFFENNNILMPNETLIIDPTVSLTFDSLQYLLNQGSPCSTASTVTNAGTDPTISVNTGTWKCARSWVEFDTSSIDDTYTIDSVNMLYEIDNGEAGYTCDYTPMSDGQPSLRTLDQKWTDIGDGTPYVSATADCSTVATSLDTSLGSSAVTDLQALLSSDYFAVGLKLNDESGAGSIDKTISWDSAGAGTPDLTLDIVYSTAPPIPTPDSIVDLTLDSSTQTTATVSFSAPNLNTGNLTTYTFNLDTPQNNNVQTFKANSTDNPYIITGLTLGTSYSANATAITEGGANYTLANILNFTTPTFTLPGAPTLSATALSDVALRFTSVLGTAGDNSTKDFSLQCELNGAGGWLNTVNNNTYSSFYEYTGLTLGDSLICQWRDGSADGWSSWSNNATDTLTLAILSAQRGIADTDDKLMQFINMVSGMGGVYFGLGVLPFGIMLIGFMAGKKTVRIFTLATLMLMGIVHASGYYVYPNWYWTLCLLFGLVLIMGRMKSD